MNTFKELRKEKKLTQTELAKQLNIDQTTVSKWELDKALPDTVMLIKLAEFFDVSTDYLLSRSTYYYPDSVNQEQPTVAPIGDTAPSSEERKLLDVYRSLSPEMRETLWSLLATWTPGVPAHPLKK